MHRKLDGKVLALVLGFLLILPAIADAKGKKEEAPAKKSSLREAAETVDLKNVKVRTITVGPKEITYEVVSTKADNLDVSYSVKACGADPARLAVMGQLFVAAYRDELVIEELIGKTTKTEICVETLRTRVSELSE